MTGWVGRPYGLRDNARRLVPLACLSFAMAASLDVVGSGALLALHAAGLPLAATGWLQLIYLPSGLSFLWASVLDRRRIAGLPRRAGWTLASMMAAAVLLAALGGIGTASLVVIVTIAFATSVCTSTAELSSQALIIETIPEEGRAWIVTTRLIASSAGSAASVIFATAVPGVSLRVVFVVVAIGCAVLTLPMLRYPEPRGRRRARPTAGRDAPWRLASLHAGVLSAYATASIMLTTTCGLALIDVGVDLPTVGLICGPATTLLSAVAMILSAAVVKRTALHRQILAASFAVPAAAVLLAFSTVTRSPSVGIVAALLVTTFDAALNVPYMRLVYRWSEGEQVAQGYAALSGAVFLLSFPARIVSPMLAAALGWPTFFAAALVLYLTAGSALAACAKE